MLTGAFTGSMPEHDQVATAFERWQGAPLDVQNVFVTWDEERDPIERLFEEQLPAIHGAGRTPMVTWEPFTNGPEETADDVDRRIAAGEFDPYLSRWRSSLREWLAGDDGMLGTGDDRHLYLRFAHEANGDWYPWSPARGTEPGAYTGMWNAVHETIMGEGITQDHVSWVWAVNHVDVGGVAAEEIYPGEDRVDWAGIDGFNWGDSQPWSSWAAPAEVFDDMLGRLRSLTDRPVCVPEYATTSETGSGRSVSEKNRWIDDAFAYFAERPIEMALWFNLDKETDWAVFDAERGDMNVSIGGRGYTAYSAYRRAIQSLGSEDGFYSSD